ncbi:MAG: DUF2851 family protein [Paludibacter sp.]|nr:DUF2851 family protein [Paludibacter sp.]
MKESVLHYIWQYKLFVQHDIRTSDGETVEIIDVGKPNPNAGPDFFNAKIRIGKTLWAGNVEIHTCSSDWNKHKHQTDPAYNNVILHVVKHIDVPVFLHDGEKVPQLELKYNESIEQNYTALLASTKWVPCSDKLCLLNDPDMNHLKTVMLLERLSQKVFDIEELLESNNNFWEEALFCELCRSFGGSLNGSVFYKLGKSIPWIVVQKHRNNLFELEALLLGQSGLLGQTESEDEYQDSLIKEYLFLSQKYQLQMISADLWRFLRLRPDNFPQIRIVQLASLLYQHDNLFPKITDSPDLASLIELLTTIEPSTYWKTHYFFGVKSKERTKKIGIKSIHQLLINAVIPMLCCYANYKNNQEQKEKAISFLEQLPPEDNYIIRKWNELGLKINTAADSQSFIHLYKHYCEEKKCLRCSIAYKLLRSSVSTC